MIFGVGTDIAAVGRIGRLYERHGERALEKLLAPAEMADFARTKDPARFLAKRFAAKEAFSKAVGTGIRGTVSFANIGIGHDAKGKPEFFYAAALAKWLADKGIHHVSLSLSDEEDMVLAFAIAEKA